MAMKHLGEPNPYPVAERYSAILQAAERLFGQKGYRGVSIDEIAEAAGVSKGLVFYHFTTKKALVERIVKDGVTTLLMRWDAIAQSGEPGQAKLRASVEALLDIFKSRPYLLRIAFVEVIFEEEMKDILANMSEEIVLRIDRLLKDGIATGEFRPVDSRIAASLLMGMCTGPPLLAALQPQPLLPVGRIADQITEIFCHGICQ
ncbi:MAG: TetR/AcrR family transcriptional regulator [Chloroflexi bacterium]|nr:TetR/AcrR family transcriptional regulator [Chloroflexota bacterium]